jgi:hypothetical protein
MHAVSCQTSKKGQLEHLITSLAILKVNWDRGHDYIDNFVPFVAECLRNATKDIISLPDLQTSISAAYGFKIPQNALKTILKRASKQGFIRLKDHMYIRNQDALSKIDLTAIRDKVLRSHEALITNLIDFCRITHNKLWTKEEGEVAFLSYLSKYSTFILSSSNNALFQQAGFDIEHADYFINSFIEHLRQNDPQAFDYLETIVKGRMLADVLFFPELGQVQKHFSGVEVYFDTNFLFRALGYTSKNMQVPCTELIDMLYEHNAILKVFDHTIDEMYGILDASVHYLKYSNVRKGTPGETIQYFIDSHYKASDVELIIARLPNLLRSLHVQSKPKPIHTERLGLDEMQLETVLREKVRYTREDALKHDIDSLTSIYRLRKGAPNRNIESCNAIFVTSNYSLARASSFYFNQIYQGYTVPICICDHVFSTIVWLKNPLIIPDFPRKRIIADCYAALNPPPNLWKKYLDEIERLREMGNLSIEDYFLLRSSMEARNILMNVTFGIEDAITEGTIEEILDKARSATRAETEKRLVHEKEKRLEAERRAIEAEAARETHEKSQLEKIRIISQALGGKISRAVLFVMVVAFIIGFYLTLPSPFSSIFEKSFYFSKDGLLRIVFITLFCIVSILIVIYGSSLKSFSRRLEIKIIQRIEQIMIKRLIG